MCVCPTMTAVTQPLSIPVSSVGQAVCKEMFSFGSCFLLVMLAILTGSVTTLRHNSNTTEDNKQAGPKRSAEILEVVLETLELEDKIRTKNALDNELASRRPGHLVSSLTQLRTKHLTPAGSLYKRLFSEQRPLRDERAQLHTSGQESAVTPNVLEYPAGEDDVYNDSARDQENTQ